VTLPRLLAITDREQADRPLDEVVAGLAASRTWVLFRDRDMDAAERWVQARHLREVTRAHGAPMSVSADPVLAAEIGAEGVHLQRCDEIAEARSLLGPSIWIGLSAHSLGDVDTARAAGADYVTLSPIFRSPSKPGYGPPLGVGALAQAQSIGLPVFALAGVTPELAETCTAAGAYGVAVMGPFMQAADPARLAEDFARAVARGCDRAG
jgi:thiamine-phosphate pyrophosphorylase